MLMARSEFRRPGPIMATMAMARSVPGKASRMSMQNIRTRSIRAPDVAGDEAEQRPDHRRHRHRADPKPERDPRRVQDPDQDVAPQGVGAEGVLPAWAALSRPVRSESVSAS